LEVTFRNSTTRRTGNFIRRSGNFLPHQGDPCGDGQSGIQTSWESEARRGKGAEAQLRSARQLICFLIEARQVPRDRVRFLPKIFLPVQIFSLTGANPG
jgi:hypothetical protein